MRFRDYWPISLIISVEVVLSSFLFEQVQFLEGLQSVHGENEFSIVGDSESLHGVLHLHVIVDDGGEVVLVLLCEGLAGSGLDLLKDFGRVVLDG